jgi:hypothetical protein
MLFLGKRKLLLTLLIFLGTIVDMISSNLFKLQLNEPRKTFKIKTTFDELNVCLLSYL